MSNLIVAKTGDTVSVHYTGKFTDGNIFDSSEGREPLEFTIGEGMMIQGFEKAVLGMSLKESKTVNIPAAEAYGEASVDNLIVVPSDMVPEGMKLEIGMPLQVQDQDGSMLEVIVKEVLENEIILDANHPLAGKELVFNIELVSVGV